VRVTPTSSTAWNKCADGPARIAGIVVGIALFGTLIVYLWRAVGAGELALERASPGPIFVAVALLIAAYAAQASAWHLLVRAVGGNQKATVDGGCWAVSLLGKYIPGKVFNAVGRMMLYRGSLPGAAGVTAALVVEVLLTLTAAACVALVMLVQVGGVAPTSAVVAAAVMAGGGLVATFSTLFDRAAGWLSARVLRTPMPGTIAPMRRIAPFALHVVSHLLMGAGLYALILGWHAAVSPPAAAIIGALCLSGIAGVAALFVPAGLGVREGVLVWMLVGFTTPAFAALIAVAARVWLTAGDAIAVAVGAWLVRAKRRDHDG
jgi:glycosyltransferase 2 family protein